MKCDKCGLAADNQALFKTEREPFCKRKTLCLSCQSSKEATVHKVVFWIPLALGLLGLFFWILHPGSVWNGLMINFGFIAVGGVGVSLMHELGHVIAGRLVGFKIFALEIGIGARALEFKRFGIRWRLKKIPVGGMVRALPLDVGGFRLKQTLFILGGPAVNAVLLLFTWRYKGLDLALEQTSFAGFVPMKLLIVMNGVALIGNLIPHRASVAQGRIASDGLKILRSWKFTPQTIAAIKVAYYSFESDECQRDCRLAEARAWLDKGLQEFPDNHILLFGRASFLIFENKLGEARKALVEMREMLAGDKVVFPFLLNNIAYVDALLDSPSLLAEADDYSQQALRINPWFVYFKGTRGLVLTQLGHYDEGIPLLKQALKDHPEKWGKAINACCLGIAAQRQGNLAESRSYFALARKLDPHCPLLDRCPKD